MSSRSLDGAIVAVVGASGGLGSAISHELAKRGAVVVAAGRDAQRLATVRDASSTVVVDITDPTAGTTLAHHVTDRFGRLDGVVVCSGVVAFGNLADTPDDVVEELFLTNVVGPLWLVGKLQEALADTGGFVANLSAVVAEQPLAGMAAYAASKAALTAADGALARELRRSGITVCDIRPPHTETGLADRPLAGAAPRLPVGLDPAVVAATVVDAIESGERDVPSTAFGS